MLFRSWLDTFDVKHLDKVKYKLERLKECTGIVCYNDEVAFSLCEILKKQGYSIPRDVSLVSIDDSDLSTIGDVMLTSVTHPKEVLGKKAAENLLRMIQNIQFNGNYEFEPHITVRKSVLSLT